MTEAQIIAMIWGISLIIVTWLVGLTIEGCSERWYSIKSQEIQERKK